MKSEKSQCKQYKKQGKPSDSAAPSMESTKLELTGLKPTDAAWVAGLIDGEGCFTVDNGPRIAVDSTCRSVIEEIHRILGGACGMLNRKTCKGRSVFRWRVSGSLAVSICNSIQEYLRDKGEQAELLTKIYKYPPHSAMRDSIKKRMRSIKRTSL